MTGSIPKKKSILIIEDDPFIRKTLLELLEWNDYGIIHAENGQIALDLLKEAQELPNLILLDLMMPVMDGYAFRAEQEKDPKISTIPVIIMTATRTQLEKLKKITANGIIKKPFDIDELINTIEKFITSDGVL